MTAMMNLAVTNYRCITSPRPREGWSFSLPVRSHIWKVMCPNFTKFSLRVIWGRGLVLLWRHCNWLLPVLWMSWYLFSYSSFPTKWRRGKSAVTDGLPIYYKILFTLCRDQNKKVSVIYFWWFTSILWLNQTKNDLMRNGCFVSDSFRLFIWLCRTRSWKRKNILHWWRSQGFEGREPRTLLASMLPLKN